VCALIAALVLPAAAVAQSSDRPNPDSPAGVEYELPLDRAREKAAGDDGPRRRGSRGNERGSGGSAPPFGEGIGPPSRPGGSGGGSGGTGGAGGPGVGGPGGSPDSGSGSSSSGGSGDGDGSRGSGDSGSPGLDGNGRGGTPGVSAVTTAQANGVGSDLGPTAAIIAAVLLAAGALGLFLRRALGAR